MSGMNAGEFEVLWLTHNQVTTRRATPHTVIPQLGIVIPRDATLYSAPDLQRFNIMVSNVESVAPCVVCGTTVGGTQSCSVCRSVFYCSKACQKRHWREHKVTCKR